VTSLIWFIVKFSLVIALAVWLADAPGKVSIVWHGYSIEASAAVLCVAVILLMVVGLFAYRILHVLRYGPRGIKTRRRLYNQQLGVQRLGQGFTALAAGDAAEAGRMALAARKLLGTTALTQWLHAQAAQLAGDHQAASTIFTQLSKEEATAMLGYRGLIGAALRQNHHARAAVLVEELAKAQPKAPWLQVARYEVATRQGAWAQAAQALHKASAQHLLDVSDTTQREAALLIAETRAAIAQQQMPRALQIAEQAQNRAPDWLPARIELVRTLLAAGYSKPALKRAGRFWETTPHPELAALYLQALGDEPPLKRFKRVEQFCKNSQQHPVSLVFLAQAAMAAELWGEASRHLQRAATLAPTRQIYLLQAELAEKEMRPVTIVRDILRQAAQAVPEAVWRCQHCGHSTPQWEINCPSCGSSGSIDWFDGHAVPALIATSSLKD